MGLFPKDYVISSILNKAEEMYISSERARVVDQQFDSPNGFRIVCNPESVSM